MIIIIFPKEVLRACSTLAWSEGQIFVVTNTSSLFTMPSLMASANPIPISASFP